MSSGITSAQRPAYFKIWNSVCRRQGWKPGDDEARYAFHEKAKLPRSTKEWDPVTDFNAFIEFAQAHMNRVDIRDRERELMEKMVDRLAAAIGEIERVPGDAYIAGIVRDMHDIEDWRNLHAPELENLRDTLKNRLSKLLTRIKAGEVACPPGKDWYVACANNPTIAAILYGKVCFPVGRGRYGYATPEEWAAQQARAAAARHAVKPWQPEPASDDLGELWDAAVPAVAADFTLSIDSTPHAPARPPRAKRGSKGRIVMRAQQASAVYDPANFTDADIPF